MEFNEFQTPLTEELISSLTTEEYNDLQEYINNVEFIKNLISPDRKRAKDLPRDDEGRIVVEITNPHILENMDYFRPAAIHFEQHGCYTKLRPNANPNSEYGKWFKQELHRCWYGMVRPSDGEWIPGRLYYYWNYCPIELAIVREGTKQADRVPGPPQVWELTYIWAHYIEQAKCGGIHDDFKGGKDAGVIARRGSGKSFFMAGGLARLFTVGISEQVSKKVKGLAVAYEKEYLNKDGILNKFLGMIDFAAEHTQFPSARHRNSLIEMNWMMGYQDAESGVIKGTKNEIVGVSAKDNPDKIRGKRSQEIIYEEFGTFPKFIDTWVTSEYNVREGEFSFGIRQFVGCVCAGTKVRTIAGKEINIEDIQYTDGILGYDLKNDCISKEPITYIQDPAYKECIRITTGKRTLECSVDHPILIRERHSKRLIDYKIGHTRKVWYEYKFKKAGELTATNRCAVIVVDVPLLNFGEAELFDPYFVGVLIGDGSYGYDKTPVLSNCDLDILTYVKTRYSFKIEKTVSTKDGKEYQELRILEICPKLREIGIYGQTKNNKRLPLNYDNLTLKDSAQLLAGLFDTDGTIGKGLSNKIISLTSSSEEMLKQVKGLLYKFGIVSTIYRVRARIQEGRKDKNDWFTLNIWGRSDILRFKQYIPIKVGYKISNLDSLISNHNEGSLVIKNTHPELIKKIENIGIQRVYNLTANKTNTYIANGIITHNTGGTENSDFSGALEMINNPLGYNVYGLPNVFDKASRGVSKTILFLGAYLNRKGYFNKDGVSDVIGALISELKERTIVKYNSSDPMMITRRRAEMPIVLQEALMKRDSTIYPVADLVDTYQSMDANPRHWDDMWIGKLSLSGGEVTYKPDSDVKVIKDFPHKDNKLEGAICIRELPIKDSTGKVPRGRYLAGIDPYDDDSSTTTSLGSLYIMDLWTDKLVFEYTGRPLFADDFYENCRRALLMYNAECNYENNKKGLFTYFSKHNALYLLSDTLQFLKDKEMMKGELYGNKVKGTIATEHIKKYGRRCIRDWLLKPIETITYNETIDGIIPEVHSVRTLSTIPFRALLVELSMWNPDGNFDRHDALLMLMLLREDKLRLLGDKSPSELNSKADANYLGKDKFFERNYKKKHD